MAYPYLKAIGKGKFHQEDLRRSQVWLVAILLAIANLVIGWFSQSLYLAICLTAIGFGCAWAIGAWLNHQLGGHTGDTYGAIVEWTEALSLAAIAFFL
jgi:adenosylcobinamide-GDP ribazoletransferase